MMLSSIFAPMIGVAREIAELERKICRIKQMLVHLGHAEEGDRFARRVVERANRRATTSTASFESWFESSIEEVERAVLEGRALPTWITSEEPCSQ
jgi:hypothetical protein